MYAIADLLKQISFPKIMGILNITADSFSDGGSYLDPESALNHARLMIAQGVDIIDIGAESTRPGARMISAAEEWQRIEPVLKALKQEHPEIQVSIDTQKSSVASQAIALGADIINDISALTWDPELAMVLNRNPQVKIILMHMQGRPETMQLNPQYNDVVAEVLDYLKARIEFAVEHGIKPENIMIDPGIGFGKTLEHNLELLLHLDRFKELGVSIVLGASRKSFINGISKSAPDERLGGSLATTTLASLSMVDIIRVHDVMAHRQYLNVLKALRDKGSR